MGNYIAARVLAIIPTLLVLLLFVVVLVRLLPGNAVDILLAENARAGDLSRAELEHRLGLDRSLPEDYLRYTMNVFRGDLGDSLWSREPVLDVVFRKLPVTLELAALSLLLGTAMGISIGIISAARQNSLLDYTLRSFSIAGLSVPNFALGTAIVVLPSIWWRWSPPLVYKPWEDGAWTHISQYFTPAAVLSLGLGATLMRITRTTMLEVLRQDYVRTARAKGLREHRVVMRHALRNALIPVVSLLGVQVAFLLSGTVIIENVFGLPGIGRELISSLNARDYPVIQGLTVVSGLLVILVNLGVDVSYGVLDPRTRTA